MNDYRCSKYCTSFDGVLVKRDQFRDDFVMKHSRCKHHYNLISQKDSNEKKDFITLFGEKCVYCGTSLSIINIDMFEIDHFIPRESFQKKDYIKADCIDNLVPACQVCNRKKSDFLYNTDNNIINVENGINRVFYRDDDFYIRIVDAYKSDNKIYKFYTDMCFDSQSRRLDYLLMNIEGLLHTSKKYKNELANIYNLLLKKRNELSSYIK